MQLLNCCFTSTYDFNLPLADWVVLATGEGFSGVLSMAHREPNATYLLVSRGHVSVRFRANNGG